jgi:hypothetical protein
MLLRRHLTLEFHSSEGNPDYQRAIAIWWYCLSYKIYIYSEFLQIFLVQTLLLEYMFTMFKCLNVSSE